MRTFPLMLAVLAACPGPAPATTDAPDPGTTTTTSTTSTTTSSSTSSDSTTTAALPDLPPPCPVGALGCPCTAGGACDPSLTCEAGLCVEGCAVGMEGCACTLGGACDAGLVCEAETCAPAPDPVSPPCVAGNQDDCCGDGVLDEFEECDLGPWALGDDQPCTLSCKMARCGDGLLFPQLQGGPEVCDDGNDVAGDGCFGCLLESCGNGRIDPGEDCEPLGPGDIECASTCLDARKLIFVTSEHYAGGEIGGVAGGDEKCQMLAEAAGLKGTFMAWLGQSDDGSDYPDLRFVHVKVPYFYTNGVQMSASWEEIYQVLGNLAPIHTETGSMVNDSELTYPNMFPHATNLVAWASNRFGAGFDCRDWSDVSAKGSAALLDQDPGFPAEISKWFAALWGSAPCDKAAPIVCVEQ